MPTPLAPAVGQRTWLGVGRSTVYNSTSSTPQIWHGVDTFSPVEKFAYIDRPEVRYLSDRVLAAQGPYSFSASLKVAPDPGAVEQLCAFSMGMQSPPILAYYAYTSATAAISSTGSQTVAVTAGTGTKFAINDVVNVDTGSSLEQVTLTAVTANSITGNFTKTHASGVGVILYNTSGIYTSTYGFAPSVTTTSTTLGTAVTTAGSQTVAVGSVVGIYTGSSIAVGGANPETVIVTGVTNNSITATFTLTHLSGVTLTVTTAFIKEPPYFMLERYRDTDCYDYFGTAIDTMKFSVDMGGKLDGFEFGLVGGVSAPVANASPTSPSFSTLQPYTSEVSVVTYTGTSGTANLATYGNVPAQSVTINLNNQLDKNYRVLGSQFPWGFPLGARKVNGTLKTGFENDNAFLDFLSQGTCSILVTLTSSSVLGTSRSGIVLYPTLKFILPNCRILQDPVSHKTSGPLDQTISFEAYSSGIGTNDSLSIIAVNQNSATY